MYKFLLINIYYYYYYYIPYTPTYTPRSLSLSTPNTPIYSSITFSLCSLYSDILLDHFLSLFPIIRYIPRSLSLSPPDTSTYSSITFSLSSRLGMRHASEICYMSIDLLESIACFEVPHIPGTFLKLRVGIHTGRYVRYMLGLC